LYAIVSSSVNCQTAEPLLSQSGKMQIYRDVPGKHVSSRLLLGTKGL
jgi:hypothetical protein